MVTDDPVQAAFDAIYAHFSKPGVRLGKKKDLYGPGPICAYRTAEGDKCAVGCLISDELYDRLSSESGFPLDGIGPLGQVRVELTEQLNAGKNGNLKELDAILGAPGSRRYWFLRQAQALHDESESVASFLEALLQLGVHHHLQLPT